MAAPVGPKKVHHDRLPHDELGRHQPHRVPVLPEPAAPFVRPPSRPPCRSDTAIRRPPSRLAARGAPCAEAPSVASTPCSGNAFFARSMPTVVTCSMTSPPAILGQHSCGGRHLVDGREEHRRERQSLRSVCDDLLWLTAVA
jgi:hypothetical protein